MCDLGISMPLSPAAKEQSWGRFHEAVVSNHSKITDITKSTELTSFLCLRLFEKLMNPPSLSTTTSLNIKSSSSTSKTSSRKKDIVVYIGGSVVAKLRKAAYRLSEGERSARLGVLSQLLSTDATRGDTLTDVLDRGGLTRIKPQIEHMFVCMEEVFAELFTGKHNLAVSKFVSACCATDDILCGFYETIYTSEADDTIKEQIFKNILSLYFKIRVHQKCRVYMDLVRS